jgi:beta-N-acetylhexosaminidase
MAKKIAFSLLMMLALLSSCAKKPPDILQTGFTSEEKEAIIIEKLIAGMNLEERIAQLFIISFNGTEPSDKLAGFIGESKAGGYVLFKENITTVEKTKSLTNAVKAASKISPFICIDEEGGVVSRLFSAGLPGYAAQPAAQIIGATGDAKNAYIAGETIGKTLVTIGVNVDFAPVADVLTNPQNNIIAGRAYSSNPEIVSDMVSAFQAGLHSRGIMSAPKHFPGHGNTVNDSHINLAIINSSLKELAANEYKPFIRAIGEGAQFIMTGHLVAPGIEPQGLPATLSGYFIKGVLRGELRFGGIIVTDAMNMGAITENYTAAQAAVMAFNAGVDMILMPENFRAASDGILLAVRNGVIPDERIRESLTRIFRTKIAAGLIPINN